MALRYSHRYLPVLDQIPAAHVAPIKKGAAAGNSACAVDGHVAEDDGTAAAGGAGSDNNTIGLGAMVHIRCQVHMSLDFEVIWGTSAGMS